MLQFFRNLADNQHTVNIILPKRVGDLKTLLDQSSNNNRGVLEEDGDTAVTEASEALLVVASSPESSSNFVDEEDDVLSTVSCHLESAELWAKFHELGTEMIITKTGR